MWWKHRSAMENVLRIAVMVVVVLCQTSAMTIVGMVPKNKMLNVSEGPDNVCNTSSCHRAASEVLKKMDRNVDPCDDFYRFACGGFLNNTQMPADQSKIDSYTLLQDKVLEQLRISIEERSPSMEPKPLKLIKNLYKACMNTTAIEAQSVQQLREHLKELGGWPVLEGNDWKEEEFNWTHSIYKLRELGYSYNYFLNFHFRTDSKNKTEIVLYLTEFPTAKLGAKLTDAYKKYMVDIAVILGAERELAKKELFSAFQFQADLHNVRISKEKRRPSIVIYNVITIAELSKLYPSIPWKEYFNRLLPSSAQVDDSQDIIIPDYIPEFVKLIEKTPKRTQANYVMWKAVAASVNYLNDEIRKRTFLLSSAEYGIKNKESRWKECVRAVSKKLPISVGALYVRKYFQEESKRNAVQMVHNIREQFHQILLMVDWMDSETILSAFVKAMSMTSHIAYPDELLDDRKLEEYYQGLELTDEHYLQAILNITLFDTEKSFSTLGKPLKENSWVSYGALTAQANALYCPTANNIVVSAAILQGDFFSNDRPRYMNYGAIGSVIGHEITHGLTMQHWLDKKGKLVLWSPSTTKKFLTKAQCIIDQYGNYWVDKFRMNLNGISTQRENIGDIGGIKPAYLAYKDWSAHNGQEQMLPDLPYTPEQMFWISSAQIGCGVQRPEQLKLQIENGKHSPPEFRILGSLSNSPEFSKDFECPLGSKMNPLKKCAVW
ncbi:neprilysin-2 [Diachasma alloeum]|uniref:neprilysin-2 n=1 Tax=Diachasma alloeum TaxID=454923 RepID=UPI00073830FD|nr:neprilysin-2 [Diachasma alloeum]